jgi:hypothetical protein
MLASLALSGRKRRGQVCCRAIVPSDVNVALLSRRRAPVGRGPTLVRRRRRMRLRTDEHPIWDAAESRDDDRYDAGRGYRRHRRACNLRGRRHRRRRCEARRRLLRDRSWLASGRPRVCTCGGVRIRSGCDGRGRRLVGGHRRTRSVGFLRRACGRRFGRGCSRRLCADGLGLHDGGRRVGRSLGDSLGRGGLDYRQQPNDVGR